MKLILCMIITLLISTSCTLVKTLALSRITVERGAIPPEFGNDSTFLICILKEEKRYNKYLIKHVKENYHGNYEFVTKVEFDFITYRDITKYRYIFDMNRRVWYSQMSNNYSRSFQYSITDLKEKIVYKCPVTSSFYSKLILAYMINLEKERLKKTRPKT